MIGYQVCCKSNEYFNSELKVCLYCDGVLDISGQLCCPVSTYVSYDTNGIASCVNTCSLDNLYQSQFCCQSITQQCSSVLLPTTCSPSYYDLQACKGCPNFCGKNNFCAPSQQEACNMTCGTHEIHDKTLGCLQCDKSCIRCTKPIDPIGCISCAKGYTFSQNRCQVCDASCITCSGFPSSCTSCLKGSKILIGQKCVTPCFEKSYYLDTQKLTCFKCST